VATILETDNSIVEVQERNDGCYGLIVHHRREDRDKRPDLSGRMAKCSYSHANPSVRQRVGASPVPSSFDLAFFEYCGPGSREATEKCVCGYLKIAHDNNGGKCPNRPLSRQRPPSRTFTPQGPREFDRFYCGCFGWD
jgi:hypothetical protein